MVDLLVELLRLFFVFFQAEDGIREVAVTGVQTCALPISRYAYRALHARAPPRRVMGQHVERERVEQQVERRPLERLAAGAPPGPCVRHLREPVALPLGLGLEPQPSQQILAGNLQPVIRELALPPPLGPAGGRPSAPAQV